MISGQQPVVHDISQLLSHFNCCYDQKTMKIIVHFSYGGTFAQIWIGYLIAHYCCLFNIAQYLHIYRQNYCPFLVSQNYWPIAHWVHNFESYDSGPQYLNECDCWFAISKRLPTVAIDQLSQYSITYKQPCKYVNFLKYDKLYLELLLQ